MFKKNFVSAQNKNLNFLYFISQQLLMIFLSQLKEMLFLGELKSCRRKLQTMHIYTSLYCNRCSCCKSNFDLDKSLLFFILPEIFLSRNLHLRGMKLKWKEIFLSVFLSFLSSFFFSSTTKYLCSEHWARCQGTRDE